METTYPPEDVSRFEHATWSRCAPRYEDGFALLTREAVEPLLQRCQIGRDSRVLDLGTGTGTAAAAAQARGARVIGVDFSEAMLAEARRLVPDADLREAPADALPLGDATVDSVVANLVLHHLARPEAALREAHRVLVAGGRVACTVWGDPESLAAFGIFFAAVEEHAGAADLPHGPLFGVVDETTLSNLFTQAGFERIRFDPVLAQWRMTSIDVLLAAFADWAQLDAFPQQTRTRIEQSVRAAAPAFQRGDHLEIPNPMLLISARKPA